jgi:DNA end-binding protein Ku
MAKMLIDNLTATFDPARHTDRYREALLQIVEEKMGEQPAEAPAPAEPARALDLMAALKASVEASRRTRDETPPAEEAETSAEAATAPAKGRRRAAAKTEAEAPARRRKAS